MERIKKLFPKTWGLFHNCKERYYLFLGKHFPKKLVKVWYKQIHNTEIDLVNPRTIDEKINWMKFHSDLSIWSRCADKYEVRHYVEECGLGHVLNEIYGVYDRAEDIDFDALPDSFVLKTTNGGGGKQVLLVKDKAKLDVNRTRKLLRGWLKQKAGYRYYEPQYFPIKPRILAEKYLLPNPGESSLNDYKITCFDGKAYDVVLCSDRKLNESVCFSVYNLDWQLRTNCIAPDYSTDVVFPKPRSFEKMIAYSNILSKGIPFVRIDWYEINGEPILSEMTFTPGGGFQRLFTDEHARELGDQLKLPLND